jgi:transcription factor SFP1
MRDFACCGKVLPNLHDLLQHYEEVHTNWNPNATLQPSITNRASQGLQSLSGARPSVTSTGGNYQQASLASAAQLNQNNRQGAGLVGGIGASGPQMMASQQTLQSPANQKLQMSSHMSDEMDAVGDMEMDETVGPMEMDDNQRTMHQTRQLFGQQQRPQLQLNASGLTQGLRTSQPTTPAAASFGLQHNPTVSSVNTPTLTTQQPLQQRPQPSYLQNTPISAGLDDLDEDLPGMPMGGNLNLNSDFSDMTFGNAAGDSNFCITDPGKHLSTPTGALSNQQRALQAQLAQLALDQSKLGNAAASSALIQRFGMAMMMPEEHKPYKCPVIGCDKAYKNQNGLK